MQLGSQNNDLMEFKEEIMEKMHILKNNFLSEFNNIFSQVNSNFEKIDMRINTISENNNSILDLVTKHKINLEKINQFEVYKSKTDQSLVTQNIQVKNILQEINQIKNNYEKIMTGNLAIPGHVGAGYKYKNLGEYLGYHMDKFNELKSETEQNKRKVNSLEKSSLNIISRSISGFQSLIDNKHRQMNILFEKKYETFNTKILELETEIEKFQVKIDNLINSIQNEIKERKINNENTEKKFEEIYQEINSLTIDFKSLKKSKFQSRNNSINNENLIFGKNKFFSSRKDIFNLNKNLRLSNLKGQIKEINNNNNVLNEDDQQKNSTSINNINNY